jgi:hypothetical protein
VRVLDERLIPIEQELRPLARADPRFSGRLTAPHGIEKPRQLPRTLCAHPSAEREMSPTSHPGSKHLNNRRRP